MSNKSAKRIAKKKTRVGHATKPDSGLTHAKTKSTQPNRGVILPPTNQPHSSGQHSGSPLARALLLAYIVIFIVGCLLPMTGWRDLGISPFDWMVAPIPQYYTRFDIGLNLLIGFPIGVLVVLAVYPVLTRWWALFFAVLFAAALSASVESAQTFLPTRVASMMDFICNVGGAAVGALIFAPLCEWLIDRSALAQLREYWFEADAGFGLVLLITWWIVQWRAQAIPFEMGDVVNWFYQAVLATEIEFSWLEPLRQLLIPNTVFFGSVVTAAVITKLGVLLSFVLKRQAPFSVLLIVCIGLAIALKVIVLEFIAAGSLSQLGWAQWVPWSGTAVWIGGAVGLLIAWSIAHEGAVFRRRVFFIAWLIAMIVFNCMPHTNYFQSQLKQATLGSWSNIQAVIFWVSLLWPFFALVWVDRIGTKAEFRR